VEHLAYLRAFREYQKEHQQCEEKNSDQRGEKMKKEELKNAPPKP
jgi:hypothetical protein